jgi:hypothetical protein
MVKRYGGSTYGQGGVGEDKGSKEMDGCPLTYMYFPHTSVPPPETTLKVQQLLYSKFDNFTEVNSLKSCMGPHY